MARKRFNFWLDDKRADDWDLKAQIDDLKKDRLFSRAIREGLRMWIESQSGEGAPVAAKSDGGAGELEEIKAMLEILVTQNKSGLMMQPPAPATTGKLLSNKVLSAPVDDDEPLPDLVLRVDAGAGLKSCNNFMQGVMSLQ